MIRPTIFFVGDFGEPFDKLKALSLPKGSAEPLTPNALDTGSSPV